jgi:segregation and condensation protein B
MPDDCQLKAIIEAALLVADKPLTLDQLQSLFTPPAESPTRPTLRNLLVELSTDCAQRGIELVETANGYRFQVKADLVPWIKRLWTTALPRYSRALLETLAIIAYRQPITRTEIEAIRGISVSTEVIKKLQDYQWIRILAYRDTPGRPALYGTTRQFLEHFNLKNLDDLPTLTQLVTMNPIPTESVNNDELIDNVE